MKACATANSDYRGRVAAPVSFVDDPTADQGQSLNARVSLARVTTTVVASGKVAISPGDGSISSCAGAGAERAEAKKIFDGRPEWIRTIDLFRVKEAL